MFAHAVSSSWMSIVPLLLVTQPVPSVPSFVPDAPSLVWAVLWLTITHLQSARYRGVWWCYKVAVGKWHDPLACPRWFLMEILLELIYCDHSPSASCSKIYVLLNQKRSRMWHEDRVCSICKPLGINPVCLQIEITWQQCFEKTDRNWPFSVSSEERKLLIISATREEGG